MAVGNDEIGRRHAFPRALAGEYHLGEKSMEKAASPTLYLEAYDMTELSLNSHLAVGAKLKASALAPFEESFSKVSLVVYLPYNIFLVERCDA